MEKEKIDLNVLNHQKVPTNLKIDDIVEIDIIDIAFGGEGVGKISGFPVFVPFVVKGEKV